MKKVCVIGLGKSGRAAAELLLAHGYEVVAVDAKEALVAEINQQKRKNFSALHEKTSLDVSSFAFVVSSPGVPPTHPLYRAAQQKKIPLLGEAALAFKEMNQRGVAITGTNGKTTVTLLVEHILNVFKKKAKALGNIGEPLSTYFLHPDLSEIVVAELSSYQLETMESGVFDAGIILNITPDHLDRYASMEEYAQAKCRLQSCMKPGSPFYVHHEAAPYFKYLRAGFKTFGSDKSADFWTDRTHLYQREKIECFLPLSYREGGSHESENALAAWLLVKEFGVTGEEFAQALQAFTKPHHRIEFVKEVAGVFYFDDSKGTNIDAVIKAVEAMRREVILIVGGVDKGASYSPWIAPFRQRVKKLFALGAAAQKIAGELNPFFPVEIVSSMEQAVAKASAYAAKGDCVLLSPGCSSFDMFRDYAARGDEFKRCVHTLKREE